MTRKYRRTPEGYGLSKDCATWVSFPPIADVKLECDHHRMGRLPAISSALSVALLPIGLMGGQAAFLALLVVNFVAFHAIWMLPRLKGNAIRASLRVPLILFAVCGLGTYAILVSQGRAA